MAFEKVLKFGGAALCDGPGVLRACQIIEQCGGDRPIVVVSAHQGVTDLLDTVASSAAQGHLEGDRVRIRHRTLLRQLGIESELLDRLFNELFHLLQEIQTRGRLLPGERDLVLSFGERMSARIVAQTLRTRDRLATPVDAFDLGLISDSNHGHARPLPGSASAIRDALAAVPGIPVITGFLAKDKHGNLTTLGRNGSDLTAALVAEAIGASELQLWKAVGGMMTADPAIVPDARVIPRLGFQEAAEYAFHGAQILHSAALAPALRADVAVRLLDVRDIEARGTALELHTPGEGPVGIAARRRVQRVALEADSTHGPTHAGAHESRGARVAELLTVFARHGVEPGLICAGSEPASVLVVPGAGVDAGLLELGRRARVVERELALAAVVGRSRGNDAQMPARALGALQEARIEVVEASIGSRQASQVFVVRADDLEACVRTLHARLLEPQGLHLQLKPG